MTNKQDPYSMVALAYAMIEDLELAVTKFALRVNGEPVFKNY